MKLLKDIEVTGRRVFVRADLDVPLRRAQVTNSNDQTPNSKLELTEQATRLTNLKPTIDWLMEHGAKQIIIVGHINRPEKPDPALSTKQLLEPLEKILGRKIAFCEQFTSDILHLTDREESMVNGQMSIVLLENLRFWPGETANDPEFAKKLAALADVYVNEAFGNCHRAHASMVVLPQLLPHAAGLHLEQEVEVLSKLLKNPARPFVAIVGGVKIETKVPVVANLAKIADWVLVGGEIARNVDRLSVLSSQFSDSSQPVGQLTNSTSSGQAGQVTDNKPGLELPYKPGLDGKNGQQRTDNGKVIIATLSNDGKDISGESIHQFQDVIANAKTLVWNGPMGVFEEGFDKGTVEIAQAIIDSGAYSVVGGGETTQFLGRLGLLGRFGFVSAGGGAMLAFLAGKELPSINALE